MKILFAFSTLCLFLITVPLRGQEEMVIGDDSLEPRLHYQEQKRFHLGAFLSANDFGMKARLSGNHQTADTLTKIQFYSGWGFGMAVLVSYKFKSFLSVRSVSGFSSNGYKIEFDYRPGYGGGSSRSIYQVEDTWLEESLDFKVSSKRRGGWDYYALCGGRYGSQAVYENRSPMPTGPVLLKFNHDDYACRIGLGMDLFLTYFKLGIECRYDQGLNDLLLHSQSLYAPYFRDIKSRMFSLSLIFET